MKIDEAISFMKSTVHLGSKPGLERLRHLLDRLGNPENKLKFIHVAGTNGKGSTCVMISKILSMADYKVGLFTSPYLEKVNEQIRIGDEIITDNDLVETVSEVKRIIDLLKTEELPTEFELITAIAFQYFCSKACDIVVLETGLGGSLDATNVIANKEIAVITNIGIDHIDFLGNNLTDIAKHKAGIISKDCIVISYEQSMEAAKVIEDKCKTEMVELRYADFTKLKLLKEDENLQVFSYKNDGEFSLSLFGEHQRKNASLAIETIHALQQKGYHIKTKDIVKGLMQVRWPARFECLHQYPYVYLDGGHNVQGIKALSQIFDTRFQNKKIIFVTGVMADKNYQLMYEMLSPYAMEFIAVEPTNKRALPLKELKQVLKHYSSTVYSAVTVKEGIELSLMHANKEDIICIVGSLYMAGEVRAFFQK